MIFSLNLILGLGLVVFQTTIKPHSFILFSGFYDLLIPFVIHVGIFRSVQEGIPVIFAFGLIMDSFTGGIFGLYTSVYFWLLVCVKWTMQIFHIKNTFVLLFIVAFGVLLENLILLTAGAAFQARSFLPPEAVRPLIIQLLWAVGTGSIFLLIFKGLQDAVQHWQSVWGDTGSN